MCGWGAAPAPRGNTDPRVPVCAFCKAGRFARLALQPPGSTTGRDRSQDRVSPIKRPIWPPKTGRGFEAGQGVERRCVGTDVAGTQTKKDPGDIGPGPRLIMTRRKRGNAGARAAALLPVYGEKVARRADTKSAVADFGLRMRGRSDWRELSNATGRSPSGETGEAGFCLCPLPARKSAVADLRHIKCSKRQQPL